MKAYVIVDHVSPNNVLTSPILTYETAVEELEKFKAQTPNIDYRIREVEF